jgi:hypothetical protein
MADSRLPPANPYAGETYQDLDAANMEEIPGIDRMRISATYAAYHEREASPLTVDVYAVTFDLTAAHGPHIDAQGNLWVADDSNDSTYPDIRLSRDGTIRPVTHREWIRSAAPRIPWEDLPEPCQRAVHQQILAWHAEGRC